MRWQNQGCAKHGILCFHALGQDVNVGWMEMGYTVDLYSLWRHIYDLPLLKVSMTLYFRIN
ncbi:hypothetical protein [Sporocytophaga sp.]|uniref:hypothetical protein n=1 Tax=Sporocytophaga sp. TaxID=2231183 RepID=UPI0025F0AD29|nr:hypothetical protein [Sporocytophaga sp.]